MQIRPATVEDSENLSALAIQVWLHTYATQGVSSLVSNFVLSEFSTKKFESALTDDATNIFVAERDQFIVAYAKLVIGTQCPAPTCAKVELATLYVQAPFQGKEVARALLSRSEQWAKQCHNTSLWLTTNSLNSRAIAFYAKHGYTKIGITYFELGDAKHENLVLCREDA
jgi:ribosomal protein S18 acetylase RimI-like enzyme